MKKTTLTIMAIAALSSCGYTRIGDLTMISNRNVDSAQTYKPLARDVSESVKLSKEDSMELCIDKLTEAHGGEYVMNAKIYIGRNRIKVTGDVWGLGL